MKQLHIKYWPVASHWRLGELKLRMELTDLRDPWIIRSYVDSDLLEGRESYREVATQQILTGGFNRGAGNLILRMDFG